MGRPARSLVVGFAFAVVLSGFLPSPRADAAGPSVAVSVSLSPSSIPADGVSTSVATATVSVAGELVPGQGVTFTSSDGGIRFGPTVDNYNGTYTTTLTSSTVAGSPTITATAKVSGQIATGDTALTQTPGPASHMTLSLQPPAIPADGRSFTTATAIVTDAHGNAIPTDRVVFSSSDPGEGVLPVANGANGTYSTLIRSSTTPGPVAIEATDTATNLSVRAVLIQTASGSILSLVTMQWTFQYAPTSTRIVVLSVRGAPPGARVVIGCRGPGCPFTTRRQVVGARRPCGAHRKRTCRSHGAINLAPYFQRRSLRSGTRISVAITEPLSPGKYYLFEIRAGRGPGVHISCLAPGDVRPRGSC